MTQDCSTDPKKQAILHAAWAAFSTYGFRKTSMDDIAREAGISRPALYLHYRNKEDIFRSLTQYFYAQGLARFQAELAKPGPLGQVLAAAFLAKTQDYMDTMLNSPHGCELMDANHAISTDIVAQGEAQLIAAIADWLQRCEAQGRAQLSMPAEQVARICEMTVVGLIQNAQSVDGFTDDLSTFCHLIGQGLST